MTLCEHLAGYGDAIVFHSVIYLSVGIMVEDSHRDRFIRAGTASAAEFVMTELMQAGNLQFYLTGFVVHGVAPRSCVYSLVRVASSYIRTLHGQVHDDGFMTRNKLNLL